MKRVKPVATLKATALQFGERRLWHDLSMAINAGEFLAVLGPNGSGKSSFLKMLLGQYAATEGEVTVEGAVGYIPQQKAFDADLPVRGRDLVSFGLNGAEWGFLPPPEEIQVKIDAAIAAVGAEDYANQPIGRLSGGEQQRLRIAQALVNDPPILLCDEPLLSLDVASQQSISALIEERRKQGAAVVFVTHEINPIMPYVDRILYLVGGKWELGTPKEVLTTESLTKLYDSPVDVLQVRGRIVVVAGEESMHHHEDEV